MNLQTLPDNDKVLRKVCKKIKNPQDPKVLLLVQEMKRIAHQWEADNPGQRCEGVAAPQVGVSLRLVILRATDDMIPKRYLDEITLPNGMVQLPTNPAWLEWEKRSVAFDPWYVMVNPRFIRSDGYQKSQEGCLSVPGKHCLTLRPDNVVFEYTDLQGRRSGHKLARGFAACAVVHELDHLNGRLNIDQAIYINPADKPFDTSRLEELESLINAQTQGSGSGTVGGGADEPEGSDGEPGLQHTHEDSTESSQENR